MPRKKSFKEESVPMMSALGSAPQTTSTRRNAASTIERTDRFKNIDDGLVPFKVTSGYGVGKQTLEVKDAVILCQKAYYNFALFRNIIDLMTEFSVNNIYFRGGNNKGREFFSALFSKINLWDLQDRFFREYYRSGNVFVYRFESKVASADIRKITQTFGAEGAADAVSLPLKYTILNPANVRLSAGLDYGDGLYQQELSEHEIQRLKNPQTDEEKELFLGLPAEVKKQLKGQQIRQIFLDLTPDKVSTVFYKKQDYEPFAVPMGYPVLEDINYKAELKKLDMAMMRTMQQIILLVTTGNEPDKHGINPKNIAALNELFKNQSAGRVLVADYTTKMQYIIPDIGDILNPEKYEVINQDINIGLNNIFAGGEKFSNQSAKVELFIARLEQGREAFINNFLMPEIKRISKMLNFKNYPTPYFEDIELKDNTNYAKIYTRLMELGILTPEQGFKAIEANTLPDPEIMVEEQKKYKSERDSGLYEPLVGGSKEAEAGRPGGAGGVKKSSSKPSPVGAKANVSIERLKDAMKLSTELSESVAKTIRKKYEVKRLSKAQQEVVDQLVELITIHEEPNNWIEASAKYCEKPVGENLDRAAKVDAIAAEHDVSHYLASLMLASQV